MLIMISNEIKTTFLKFYFSITFIIQDKKGTCKEKTLWINPLYIF